MLKLKGEKHKAQGWDPLEKQEETYGKMLYKKIQVKQQREILVSKAEHHSYYWSLYAS